jgi:signal transduction histidine kinase
MYTTLLFPSEIQQFCLILATHHIESQNLSLKLEQIDLGEIILNAKRNQPTKQVNLLYQQYDKDNTILIQADKGRLNQVISNLISNAIKFTEEGTIIITSKKEEEENKIVISIKDSGIPKLYQVLSLSLIEINN